MDIIYLIIFLILTMIREMECALLKRTDFHSFKIEDILFESVEISILQCAQRCKFHDRNAGIMFKDSKCSCVSNKGEKKKKKEKKDQRALTRVFVIQDIMKMEEKKKMPEPKVFNIALNKPATQSTTPFNAHPASKANDGDENTNSVAGKNSDIKNYGFWWQVDLGEDVQIEYIIFRAEPGAFKRGEYKGLSVQGRTGASQYFAVCYNLGNIKDPVVKFSCVEGNEKYRYLKMKMYNFNVVISEFEVYTREK